MGFDRQKQDNVYFRPNIGREIIHYLLKDN
ncbi:hypothetical protein OF001_U220030 [Pseudomonas sp. OF001]|nr:hypothetical protein OF001_U220030 [Pseudomonas sp. OF001]